jgi:hypothetical protein
MIQHLVIQHLGVHPHLLPRRARRRDDETLRMSAPAS